MTKIITCTCEHAYQDLKYGTNKRVCNQKVNKSGAAAFRCTVCCKEHQP